MAWPSDSILLHCSSVYGSVTRGDSWMRVTFISKLNSLSHSSTAPEMGAALVGSGVQASGMWPSPASKPEVGSRPIQPPPGRYTSVQACKSVKSFSAPLGPSSAFTSGPFDSAAKPRSKFGIGKKGV